MSFENLKIVLVSPTHPGNIGGVARTMKNMALRNLALVLPADHTCPEAIARSAGAEDVLDNAQVYGSLNEALSDCRLVIGTTARPRRLPWPELDPRIAARMLSEEAYRNPVALVFGAERTGLTNHELEKCHAVVTIPCNPDFSSLNLVSAVQIFAYELFLTQYVGPVGGAAPDNVGADEQLADNGQVERFYQHLEQTLTEIRFFNPHHNRVLMRRLIRLFNRVRLETNEVNILRGILTAVQNGNVHGANRKHGEKTD